MRTVISTLLGATLALAAAVAHAQTAPPPPPPPPPDEPADEHVDLAGFRDGFFIRDRRDLFRFYPTGLLHVDLYSAFGPGVMDNPKTAPKKTALPADVQSGLEPHLFIRRARIGFAGEFLKRWSFMLNVEFGGQAVGNVPGTAETSAATAGNAPTASSGRYAPLQTITSAVVPLDAYINFRAWSWLNVMVGQVQMPFSMENQTGDAYGTWMERSMPIRSFVVPGPRDIGAMLWGEVGPHLFDYGVGVFGGDGQNRPSIDGNVDVMGRVYTRPFAADATSDVARYFQIGASARHGTRNPTLIGFDATPISTTEGFVLWKPTYTDSQKRLVHVIPSGAQNAVGGELRLRAGRFAFQGEAYYVANDTREALDGYQLTNTERLGMMKGVGWYGELSAWPAGDAFVQPEPGMYRPKHLDLDGPAPEHSARGLQVMMLAAGVNGSYAGASRSGVADKNTPKGDITVYQLGLGATYWYTRLVRLTVNYMAYLTPGSGSSANEAVVPDNLRKLDDKSPSPGHVLHELSARLAVTF